MGNCRFKEVVLAPDAPKAIGPYSVSVKAGPFVFTAGQLGVDPISGNLVEGGVEAQTHQAFANLKTVLIASGSGLEHIVKTTVFLQDMGDFARVNAIYAQYFSSDFPARSAVQVAALPKGGAIEIEAVALVPESGHDC